VHQPGISVVTVAGSGRVHVRAGTAACTANLVAEAVEVERSNDRLAAVGDGSLRSLPVEQRHFAVFADQAEAISVDRG